MTLTLNFIICELSSYDIKAIVACILRLFKTSLSFIFEMTYSLLFEIFFYKWGLSNINYYSFVFEGRIKSDTNCLRIVGLFRYEIWYRKYLLQILISAYDHYY